MDTIASLFLKSIVSSGILLAYYSLVLRNKRFHQYNRFYLLLTLVIPVVIPFLNFRLYSFEQPVSSGFNNLSPVMISNTAVQPHSSFTWESVLYLVIISISMVMLLTLFSKIIWIYKIKNRHIITRLNGFNLIETELKQAPFCFLNNLFWRKDISMLDDSGKKIFNHELTHIRERHTYDKLFSQIILCFFWINPFYWFIQKELNVVHEFIADSNSIQDGDAESFALMLLQSHNEGRYLNPSHSFFHSSIKRRLIMITASKNTQYSYLRRVLVLPITVLVFILFSFTIVKAQSNPGTNPDPTKVVKIIVNNDLTKANIYDTTIRASVKFVKKDGTTDSVIAPVKYWVNAPNTNGEKISRKDTIIRAKVNFVKNDGTTESVILPVTYSIGSRPQ